MCERSLSLSVLSARTHGFWWQVLRWDVSVLYSYIWEAFMEARGAHMRMLNFLGGQDTTYVDVLIDRRLDLLLFLSFFWLFLSIHLFPGLCPLRRGFPLGKRDGADRNIPHYASWLADGHALSNWR